MPKYTEDMAKGDWGEYFLAYNIVKNFGWPCRTLDIDIGIDAQIEVIDNEFNTTGRFIGVQVKTGGQFKISAAHIAYWRSCDFPIIIVHINPQTEEMHYRHVDNASPSKEFRNVKWFHPFDENEKDILRELSFHESIVEVKKQLGVINNELINIQDNIKANPQHLDHEECDDFMIDFDDFRDQLIECRTTLLPIYKSVGDCGYHFTLQLYSDTRDRLISYKRSLQSREEDIHIINIFEKSANFDSKLELPTNIFI